MLHRRSVSVATGHRRPTQLRTWNTTRNRTTRMRTSVTMTTLRLILLATEMTHPKRECRASGRRRLGRSSHGLKCSSWSRRLTWKGLYALLFRILKYSSNPNSYSSLQVPQLNGKSGSGCILTLDRDASEDLVSKSPQQVEEAVGGGIGGSEHGKYGARSSKIGKWHGAAFNRL